MTDQRPLRTTPSAPSEIEMIAVDDIVVGGRRRRFDPERLAPLMDSIAQLGLQTPITVCFDGDDRAGTPLLVAGLHRLTAYRRLGRTHIEAFVASFDDLQRELWEIDENLMRAELSELEIAEHHKRRKEILEASGGARRHGGDRRASAQIAHLRSYADQAGDGLKVHSSTVRRAVRRAQNIDPLVADAIKDTPAADKGVELDALASMKPNQQIAALRLVNQGKADDFRSAKLLILGGNANVNDEAKRQRANDRAFEAMKRAWAKAEFDVQQRFVCWLELEGHLARCRPGADKQKRRSG